MAASRTGVPTVKLRGDIHTGWEERPFLNRGLCISVYSPAAQVLLAGVWVVFQMRYDHHEMRPGRREYVRLTPDQPQPGMRVEG